VLQLPDALPDFRAAFGAFVFFLNLLREAMLKEVVKGSY